jgi:hypothetical protein
VLLPLAPVPRALPLGLPALLPVLLRVFPPPALLLISYLLP